MKKTLLLGALLLAGFGANAQIANGTQAPDFTATDLNGNVHTLSEYLAQGKTVILDVSATWCGPCWAYHNTHALEDLYESYGQDGSSEVVVLFVEGDPQTTLDNLNGISGPIPTQGNWVAGTPYPIINNDEIFDLYNMEHFPTILRICPDGIMTEVAQKTAAQLKTLVNQACLPAETPLVGINDKAKLSAANARYCGENGVYKSTVRNLGANAITTATVELREGENVLTTVNYTGNLAQFANATITFSAVDFGAGDHSVVVTTINGVPYTNEMGTVETSIVPNAANETTNNFEARLYTDNYPGEASFRIRKMDTNAIVYTSPALTAGPAEDGAGGPDANTTKSFFITLPEGMDCYKVELKDTFGDGWSLGSTEHGLRIFNGETMVFEQLATSAFTSLIVDAAFKTTGVLDTPSVEAQKGFGVYPNPTTGVLNISTQETVDVVVMDLTGKVVHAAKGIENGGSINISSLQSGVYIAKISGDNFERTEKIIKQ